MERITVKRNQLENNWMRLYIGKAIRIKVWDSIKLINPNHPSAEFPVINSDAIVFSTGRDSLCAVRVVTVTSNDNPCYPPVLDYIVVSASQVESGEVEIFIFD